MAGWSGSPKDLPGVASFHGEDGFLPFLSRSDILVCLLPLTRATTGILDARAFAALPRGASLISVGRGPQVVEADLLAALDSGHLDGATLDVFRAEPLPADSPFWDHPRVVVVPHVASMTIARTACEFVIDNIRRFEAGKPLYQLLYKSITVRHVLAFQIPVDAKRSAIADIDRWMRDEALTHHVGERFPMSRVIEAHEAVEAGAFGKVVLEVDA